MGLGETGTMSKNDEMMLSCVRIDIGLCTADNHKFLLFLRSQSTVISKNMIFFWTKN